MIYYATLKKGLAIAIYLHDVSAYTIRNPSPVSCLYLHLGRVGIATLSDRYRKLLHKDGQSAKFTRKDKVKERPQLLEVVLHRGAGENEPVGRGKLLHREGDLRIRIADLVAFVEDDVIPFLTNQKILVDSYAGIGCDKYPTIYSTM